MKRSTTACPPSAQGCYMPSVRALRAYLLTVCLLAMGAAAPRALAWSPPGPGGDAPDWAPADISGTRTTYDEKAHQYIIEHAIDILRNDGKENRAEWALQYLQPMANGVRHADHASDSVYLWWNVDLFYFATIYADSMYLCNTSSFEHFYNPGTGKGLDLSSWSDLEQVGEWGQFISILVNGLSGFGIPIGVSGGTTPELPRMSRSAVDLCQDKFNLAVQKSSGLANWYDGMVNLGWSVHAISDLTVVQHTYDSWITHDNYENLANGFGSYNTYHATSARATRPNSFSTSVVDGDVYSILKGSTPRQLAIDVAEAVHNLQMYQQAEGAGCSPSDGMMTQIVRWASKTELDPEPARQAIREAIPIAERASAALIDSFMEKVGVPEKTPPLIGEVVDSVSHKPIAGAYIFYGTGKTVPVPSQPVGVAAPIILDFVRSDADGRFPLNVKAGQNYWIRPSMPGYRFEGVWQPGETLDPALLWTQPAAIQSSTVRLQLVPEPQLRRFTAPQASRSERLASGRTTATPPGAGGTIGRNTALVTMGDLQARRFWFRAPAGSVAALAIKPNTALPASHRVVTTAMAEKVTGPLLELPTMLYGDDPNPKWQFAHRLRHDQLTKGCYIQIQVNHVADLVQGKELGSSDDIVAAIDNSIVRDAAPAGTAPPASACDLVKNKAQRVSVVRPDGSEVAMARTAAFTGQSGNMPACANTGIVPLPAPAGVLVQVKIVPGDGYVGDQTCQPVTVTTDSTGRAAFVLHAGNRAGKVRLFMKVVNDPAVSYPVERAIEFMLVPAASPDTTPLRQPSLEAASVFDWPPPPADVNWHEQPNPDAQRPGGDVIRRPGTTTNPGQIIRPGDQGAQPGNQ